MNRYRLVFQCLIAVYLISALSCASTDMVEVRNNDLDKIEYRVSYSFKDSIKEPYDFYTVPIYRKTIGSKFEFVALDVKIYSDNSRKYIFRFGINDIYDYLANEKVVIEIEKKIYEFDYSQYGKVENPKQLGGGKYSEIILDITAKYEIFYNSVSTLRLEAFKGNPVNVSVAGIENIKMFYNEYNNKEYMKK